MAEGVLFDLAGNVLQLLGSIIVDEVKLASNVETEIEYLTDTVSTIRAVLLDAEKRSSHSDQIKDWAAQGFIKLSDSKQRVEDVGREYSMVLLLA